MGISVFYFEGGSMSVAKRHFYGVMRRSRRFELYEEPSGQVTIRRFADGNYVFVSDERAREFRRDLSKIVTLHEAGFDYLMTAEMQK
jgi:hypothetical protein